MSDDVYSSLLGWLASHPLQHTHTHTRAPHVPIVTRHDLDNQKDTTPNPPRNKRRAWANEALGVLSQSGASSRLPRTSTAGSPGSRERGPCGCGRSCRSGYRGTGRTNRCTRRRWRSVRSPGGCRCPTPPACTAHARTHAHHSNVSTRESCTPRQEACTNGRTTWGHRARAQRLAAGRGGSTHPRSSRRRYRRRCGS